jgi:hypothetical protein
MARRLIHVHGGHEGQVQGIPREGKGRGGSWHGVFISSIIFGEKELEAGPLSESPLYRSVQRQGIRL